MPLQSVGLHFEGVIRVEGTLLRCVGYRNHELSVSYAGPISASPRKHFILFSTKNPPAIQRIPWPAIDDTDGEGDGEAAKQEKSQFEGYDTWIFNDQDFSWFVEPEGMCACSRPFSVLRDS